MIYHIVWTMYGSWLPGDDRGWLQKGEPAVQPPDPALVAANRARMKEPLVLLDRVQQDLVTETIVAHCRIRKWTLFAKAVRSNHVHVVVEADRNGDDVRDQLKAWGSRHLSDHAGLKITQTKNGGRKRWFTEKGHVCRVETEEYLQAVIAYVLAQQELPDADTPAPPPAP